MTRRQPPGIPTGGQFAAGTHTEPNVQLNTLSLPVDMFEPRHAGLPAEPPHGSDFVDDQWADYIVSGVDAGPLSRGVVNHQRREAFRAWHRWAFEQGHRSQEHYDFALGLRSGICALYERRLRWLEPVFDKDRFNPHEITTFTADAAVDEAGRKRASAADREHWRRLLKHAPSEATWRGHLAAGVILSGQDEYWGLRADPDRIVRGASTAAD